MMFITARGFANDLDGAAYLTQRRDEVAMTGGVVGKGAWRASGMRAQIQGTLGDVQTEISDDGIHKCGRWAWCSSTL
jgi:hypothetical protein